MIKYSLIITTFHQKPNIKSIYKVTLKFCLFIQEKGLRTCLEERLKEYRTCLESGLCFNVSS